jgi:alkanesulfonate monooxygenase SsuD/methylene tetrahydromethanopterin reductase-like flavin-dependent oxidoreductase (luciferase family)
MILSMYVAADDGPEADERVIGVAIEQSLLAGQLGFNPWFTEHHFRGPWHSNPMQFAAYLAPQLPPECYLGFGVLSTPYYNPIRLVEGMNLLDQLTKGHTLYGLGSGFPGKEPAGMGLSVEYHGSGQAARDTLEIVENLWKYRTGDPHYHFDIPTHRGTVSRRVTPAPYRKRHPTIIRTASADEAVIAAAQKGWPAFLGTFSAESSLADQIKMYRAALAQAKHPREVIEECLRWCTCDWLAVVVANSDAEALERAAEAKAEQLELRNRFIAQYGSLDGPVIKRKPGESVATAYAAGGDSWETIAGHPDTVAEKVQNLVDLGINHLLLRFLGEWAGRTRAISNDSMHLFSRRIMPRFKQVAPPPATLIE